MPLRNFAAKVCFLGYNDHSKGEYFTLVQCIFYSFRVLLDVLCVRLIVKCVLGHCSSPGQPFLFLFFFFTFSLSLFGNPLGNPKQYKWWKVLIFFLKIRTQFRAVLAQVLKSNTGFAQITMQHDLAQEFLVTFSANQNQSCKRLQNATFCDFLNESTKMFKY